jgi:competence protein ComEC
VNRLVEDRWPTLLVTGACIGIAVANWIAAPALTTFVAALACLSLALATQPDGRRLASLAVALALLGLAWGVVRVDALDRSALASRVGEIGSAQVVVTGPPRSTPFAIRVPVDVRRFDGGSLRERALLELRPGRSPPRGAVLEIVRARLVAPRGPETGFDERAWLARRGIHVVVRADDARIVGRRGGIGGVADRLRAHVETTLAKGADGERLALLRGFVLGDDDGLDDELQQAFRASGLAHMTAVSGQNVVIVAAAVASLPWLLGIGRLGVHLAAIVGILAYALAVGWEPSVVRASVAGCVTSVAWLASRADDRWHALALGALVLLVWQPASLLDPGFQLSFAAVAAILLVVPRARAIAAGCPVSEEVAVGISVAVACSVTTAPISWLHFGALPVWSVPANLAAEPAMPVVLALSLAGAAVAPVVPSASIALVWLAGWAAWWIASCARAFASLPHAQIRSTAAVSAFGLLVCAAVALPVALRRLPVRNRTTVGVAALGLVSVALVGWPWLRERPAWTPPAGLRVTFVDVGQGDGTLLETPRGAVLVDEGPPEARMADQLRSLGVRSLSVIVLTHPQRDHVGGAADVLRRLHVGAMLDPGIPSDSRDEAAALDEAQRRGVPVKVVHRGDSFRLGRLVIRVLWPDGPGSPADDPNNHAVVLLASFGATDVLLTADAESDVTGSLPLRQIEVLKVAHHGSEDAGLERQLRVLHPRVAVISVGRGNDYGHPRPETLAALRTVPGLRLYRTDVNGRVVVESDGRTLRVTAERG